jgi:hypothetical protein
VRSGESGFARRQPGKLALLRCGDVAGKRELGCGLVTAGARQKRSACSGGGEANLGLKKEGC